MGNYSEEVCSLFFKIRAVLCHEIKKGFSFQFGFILLGLESGNYFTLLGKLETKLYGLFVLSCFNAVLLGEIFWKQGKVRGNKPLPSMLFCC